MTRQQLLILLGAVLVLLINLVTHALRRWGAGKAPQVPPRGHRPPPAVVEPRRAQEEPSTAPPRLAVSPDRPRQRSRGRLESRRAVRRGIVLMTILGPCRALEPPDPRA